MLVVQYGGIFVVSQDIVVRHLLFTLHASLQIPHMRFILGGAAPKRGERGSMTEDSKRAGPAHAFELVGCLHGSVVVQPRQQLWIIDGSRFSGIEAVTGTYESHPADIGPMRGGFRRIRHGDHVYGARPMLLGQARRLVPVVVRLVEQ